MASYTVNISSYTAFRKSVLGNGYDMDGYYGYQCWDGVDLFYSQLGATLSTGGTGLAYMCWQNASARSANTLSSMTQITKVNDLKQGDIIVLKPDAITGIGDAGHIAFCNQDFTSILSMQLLGQNQGLQANASVGTVFNIMTYNISAFIGGWRYNPWHGGGGGDEDEDKTTTTPRRGFPWAVALHHWNNFKN